jgi:hypothetical protein
MKLKQALRQLILNLTHQNKKLNENQLNLNKKINGQNQKNNMTHFEK